MPKGRTWVPTTPARVPPDVKGKLCAKARKVIDSELRPAHVKPPPDKPRFNYIADMETKWRGPFFYFIAKYASPGPHAVAPFFYSPFARLEYKGDGRFGVAYMRHTGQWWQIHSGLTMDQALDIVSQGGLFQP